MFCVADGGEKQGESDSPYLGAEEVISEVVVLLARIDNERQETEKKLLSENEKVAKLSRKIDELCMKRLRDLPALVQKGTVMDTHVSYPHTTSMELSSILHL